MSDRPVITFDEKQHKYTLNGEVVPSVTQVIGVLDKPALVPWAAREAVNGAWKLARRKGYVLPESPQQFTMDLQERRLDYRNINRIAIDRGNAVHKVLEDWINERKIPLADNFPVATRGYVRALAKFIVSWEPHFLESEKNIGSVVHGFAGKRDTVAILEHSKHGRVLLDVKTSKKVYPDSMFPQLRAYEIGGVECGEEPTQRQGIVRVSADGEFEVVWSCAEDDDFLSILHVYKTQKQLEKRARRIAKEQKQAAFANHSTR